MKINFFKNRRNLHSSHTLKVSKKWTALVLATVFLVPIMPKSAVAVTTTSEMQEIYDRQDELQSQEDELNSKLEELQSQEADAQEYSNTLQEKIDLTEEKIDTAVSDIATLNANIKELQKNIDEADEEYADTLELLKKRIRAIYESGDTSTLEILLNATSLYDFSMKSEMLSAVTAHDKQLCDEIQEYIDKTKDDKANLKTEKSEVSKLKKSLEEDQEELESLIEENNALIEEIQGKESDTQSEIDSIEQEDEELNSQLEDLIAAQKKKEEEEAAAAAAAAEAAAAASSSASSSTSDSSGSSDGNTVYTPPTSSTDSGGLSGIWPLPGYGTSSITQYFGENGHGGVDIGVPYGTPIVAVASGTVLNASYHWSWGNNVLIYHNGTYSTRYAHMSVIACNVGDYVEQGQVIGYVGSTGNSTGNHLHFEVYENGTRINGLPFIT